MGADGGNGAAGDATSPDDRQRSSIANAIDSVKSWFGGQAERSGARSANMGLLRPSLKATKAMKNTRREGDVTADQRTVQELQDSDSAVTNVVFGQERQHRAFVLLAAASKDGSVVVYRCY